jgi:putative heme-binding domain-containing protein
MLGLMILIGLAAVQAVVVLMNGPLRTAPFRQPTAPLQTDARSDVALSPTIRETFRGRALLEGRLACAACHSFSPGEPTEGPDLSGVGVRLSREDLIISVLAPNMVIAKGYATTVITLRSGRIIAGRIIREEHEFIVVEEADGPLSLSTRDIQTRRDSSPMPSGQVDDLTEGEFRALIDLLESLGTPGGSRE